MITAKVRFLSFQLAGLALLGACGSAFLPPEERSATQTANAIDAIALQTLQAFRTTDEPAPEWSPEPQATNTNLPATTTPLPSATPWPDPVRVEVSIDTNCRSGPGPEFPMIGALMVGESAIVRAKVLEIDYWLVENPDNPGRECWLWGRHATLSGDTEYLPIATPPWTATPEPGTIAGWAFIDMDNNATRNPGDTPISGITLFVRTGSCPGGSGVAMATTDADGRYLVSALIPTLYCVSHDGKEALYPNTWTISLSPGQFRDEVNFRRAP